MPAWGWLLLAVVLGGVAAWLLGGGSDTNGNRRRVLAALLSSMVPISLWFGQQTKLQQWASRPEVEIKVDKDGNLVINNRGPVDLKNIEVFFTAYTLNTVKDTGGHWVSGEIQGVSPANRSILSAEYLQAYDLITLNLHSVESLIPFYDPFDPANTQKIVAEQYCFRIAGRVATSNAPFVRYYFASAARGSPSPLEDFGFGGGFQTSMKFLEVRRKIIDHQRQLFHDEEAS